MNTTTIGSTPYTPSKYSKLARTAALAVVTIGFITSALFFATASQARPVYVSDGAFIQGPQLVISPPQLVVAPPVYVQPPRAVVVRPPVYVVTRPVNYRPGHVYYIHGRPYLNGYPYRAQYRHHGYDRHYDRHHDRHFDKHHGRHDGRHDQGRHSGWDR